MGLLRRIFSLAVLLLALSVGLIMVASESGEVVVLRTFENGVAKETRLWIVDDQGTSWLRSGGPASAWYQRILANPDIEVERGGETFDYRAFPLEGGPAADHVNALMLRKYSWADQVIDLMADRTDAIAIRLDPR